MNFFVFWFFSVCRKCIYNKLSDEELDCCPICNIDLGCVPLEKLRSDHYSNISPLLLLCNGKVWFIQVWILLYCSTQVVYIAWLNTSQTSVDIFHVFICCISSIHYPIELQQMTEQFFIFIWCSIMCPVKRVTFLILILRNVAKY